jgi:SAM-dependent methyltransferase
MKFGFVQDIHAVYAVFARRFRPGRVTALYSLMGINENSRVLDIGGTAEFWEYATALGLPRPRLVIINLDVRATDSALCCACNAEQLPFVDGAFDIAVSNSVIEHVANPQRFASEARRVARRHFIQTPNRAFPIEPHYIAPFVHWLPRALRPAALRFTPWAMITHPTQEERRTAAESIRLLGHSDMRRMFPDSRILSERFVGLSKSLIAVRT